MVDNDKYWCECKKCNLCQKDYVCNHATCNCKIGKYLGSVMDHSAIMCDKVIQSYYEETKTISTNFNEKKEISKTHNFYILLVTLWITIALLIAVSIYCYLIKHQEMQKYLLPSHVTNNELTEVLY